MLAACDILGSAQAAPVVVLAMQAAVNRSALAAASPFTDGEELGDAWHAIAGFGRVWTSNEVDALLLANPLLAFRCAASTEALFFGPTRELLRTRALAHPSVRALRNLRRFRCIVWAVAKLLILEREARERVNAPGGVGFLQAQASFSSAVQDLENVSMENIQRHLQAARRT